MSSHPVGRRKLLRSVKSRALVVAITLSSLAFVATAYWHYRTHAATDYVCVTMNGALWANPIEKYKLYDNYGNNPYRSIYLIDRQLIDGAVVNIEKVYLEDKYPHLFTGYLTDSKEEKAERRNYYVELATLKQEITKQYETRYIEDAIGFALKWTALLPLSLATVLTLFFATKNFILYGSFKVSRSSNRTPAS